MTSKMTIDLRKNYTMALFRELDRCYRETGQCFEIKNLDEDTILITTEDK